MMLSPAAVADLLREASRRSPRRCSEALAHVLAYRPRWTPKRVPDGSIRDAVLRVVREHGPVRAGHVATLLGKRPQDIAPQLSRLCDQDEIERVRHGVYK